VQSVWRDRDRSRPPAERKAMTKKAKKVPFDPRVFLATVNGGRSISKYRTNQKVFSQGKPADEVFYIQKGKERDA
jgi:hypothetical protein